MSKKIIYFFTICFISIYFLGITASADGNNFAVRAVIPENQEEDKGYFDLKLAPGETQVIQMIIDNSDAEDIIAKVALNAASTGQDGLIVYNQADVRDESMQLSITDVARVIEPEITVPANSSKTVEIKIQMPEQTFDGVVLGGLYTTARKASGEEADSNTGTTINNEFAYVIGIQIAENETEVDPDFDFVSVTPGLVNYHNAVTFAIRNKAARIVKGMQVDADIYKKNSASALRDLKLTDVEMAPNSTGEFVIDWNNNIIESGAYRLHLTVQYQGEEWSWDEDFTISKEDATTVNKSAVNLPASPTRLYVAIAVLLLLLLLLALIFLRYRKKDSRTGTQSL